MNRQTHLIELETLLYCLKFHVIGVHVVAVAEGGNDEAFIISLGFKKNC